MVIKISILKKSIYINVCVKNGIQIKTNPFQFSFISDVKIKLLNLHPT